MNKTWRENGPTGHTLRKIEKSSTFFPTPQATRWVSNPVVCLQNQKHGVVKNTSRVGFVFSAGTELPTLIGLISSSTVISLQYLNHMSNVNKHNELFKSPSNCCHISWHNQGRLIRNDKTALVYLWKIKAYFVQGCWNSFYGGRQWAGRWYGLLQVFHHHSFIYVAQLSKSIVKITERGHTRLQIK